MFLLDAVAICDWIPPSVSMGTMIESISVGMVWSTFLLMTQIIYHSDNGDSFTTCPVVSSLESFGTSCTASLESLMPLR